MTVGDDRDVRPGGATSTASEADPNRYARPHRPRLIRFANGAASALGRVGLAQASLEPAGLIDAARKREGGAPLEDESVVPRLERLVDSIEREARLNPLGRAITRGRLVTLLANRLRAEAVFRAHPEIVDVPLPAPVVITGLQRSGTTKLHRLLATDPRLRALATYEALAPALRLEQPQRRSRHTGDPRVRVARRAERGLRYLSPDYFAVHPVEHLAPEEEVLLLDQSLLSTVPEATLRVPSYALWVEEQDQRPAYEWLRKTLQLMSWQDARAAAGAAPVDPAEAGARWVLKTPHHLEWLDTLFEVFPDATVVQTHRDPAVTLASFCSMIALGRGVFSDDVDPHEVGAHWGRKIARMLDRAMDTRERRSDAGFVDVSYYALVRDGDAARAELERIYAAAGLELGPEVWARIDAAARANQQHKYGRHTYRLEDFGLSAEGVERWFARYRARFHVRHERAR